MPPPAPLGREIKQLRRLIRQTRRHIDTGTIDFIKGGTLISTLIHTLARVHLIRHRLAQSAPSDADHAQARIKAELERVLIELGLGPQDP